MEQRVSETPCFVTTLYINLILTLWIHLLLNSPDEIKHVLVIRPYRDIRQNLIFLTKLAFQSTQSEICGMDIHPDFEYPIHEVISFACGKPRCWRDLHLSVYG